MAAGMAGGRNQTFMSGAYSGSPVSTIHSVQQGAGAAGFTPNSVLEENHILSQPNGMSAADRARMPVGQHGASLNGQSDSTFQTRMWLGSAPRTYGG